MLWLFCFPSYLVSCLSSGRAGGNAEIIMFVVGIWSMHFIFRQESSYMHTTVS
jgi:hypothetical protein